MNWTADFPILAADENGKRLVYLDSAATTQHPTQVLNAVVNYYNKENANPHRGVYELAMRATDAHEGARHTVAQFFNAEDDEIVFTQNTTESLNLVAYSYGMNFLHEGDEIVISVAEHHSNMVPWQRVAKATGAKLVYMYPGENGRLTTEELDRKITPKTKVVAVAMVSNVLGLRAPVEEIVKRAHAVGAVVVLDCAQSAPHTPVDVKKLDVDFAACSAHKLYAPMGVGALYARAELLEKMLEKKVTLVPTLSIIKWFGEYEEKNGNQAAADRFYHNVEKHGEFVKAAWEAGVPIACGTDENGMHGTGRCPEEYVSLAKAGLPNYAILQGANSVAAKTLDLQDKTGSLEAGKSADILVLNKNPLEDISILRSKENIAYVVQGV